MNEIVAMLLMAACVLFCCSGDPQKQEPPKPNGAKNGYQEVIIPRYGGTAGDWYRSACVNPMNYGCSN